MNFLAGAHLHEVGQKGYRLDRLAESHFVRQDSVQVVVVQRNLGQRQKKGNIRRLGITWTSRFVGNQGDGQGLRADGEV